MTPTGCKDNEAAFPEEFYRAVADAGLLGIAMPEAFGGSGLGITEAARTDELGFWYAQADKAGTSWLGSQADRAFC